MSELSPAAQAVWNRFLDHYEWTVTTEELFAVAAALRAAADQLTPYSVAHMEGAAMARNKLLDIANELENCN